MDNDHPNPNRFIHTPFFACYLGALSLFLSVVMFFGVLEIQKFSDRKEKEISDSDYGNIRHFVNDQPELSDLVENCFKDNIITFNEFDKINDAWKKLTSEKGKLKRHVTGYHIKGIINK